jgi:polar amino acid transport system substrate-binding protein
MLIRRFVPACVLVVAVHLLPFTHLASTTAQAQQRTDPRVADLVQAGKVRVGLFPPQFVKDSATGALRGVWAEMAGALAARLGVPLVLVERPTPPEAVACLKASACDVLFLPFDDRAAAVGDFSHPIFQFDYTLLVPSGSAIRKVMDADRAGTRIAAVRNHASTVTLAGLLKQAELVYADTPEPTFELLRSGKTHVMVSTRNALLQFSDQLPGSHVLDDRYGANINRMVVPKGKAGWLAYVTEFVEEAKASGLVRRAIDRVGPRGVTVAPPGDPK